MRPSSMEEMYSRFTSLTRSRSLCDSSALTRSPFSHWRARWTPRVFRRTAVARAECGLRFEHHYDAAADGCAADALRAATVRGRGHLLGGRGPPQAEPGDLPGGAWCSGSG